MSLRQLTPEALEASAEEYKKKALKLYNKGKHKDYKFCMTEAERLTNEAKKLRKEEEK